MQINITKTSAVAMENRLNKWYKDIKEKMVKSSKEVEG